jgi:transcriptional regulator with XRE-family HTH domain
MEEPGEKLKKIRQRLRLSYREVEIASEKIAARRGNEEYLVALSRLSDIENKGTLPSMYRVYSLCAIYRLDLADMLSWYGIDLGLLPADYDVIAQAQTHGVDFRPETQGSVQVPISLDPGIDVSRTIYLSRAIQRWGKLPLLLLQNIDLKLYRYGLIGTEDWSMHPLIPPGSLVVIDETQREIRNSGWSNEIERPIYFLEHSDGHMCGWCWLRNDRVTVQYHPASFRESESYAYPSEIAVVGRVTRVALSLEEGNRRRPSSSES